MPEKKAFYREADVGLTHDAHGGTRREMSSVAPQRVRRRAANKTESEFLLLQSDIPLCLLIFSQTFCQLRSRFDEASLTFANGGGGSVSTS